jgi:Amt family ammonium transporter
VQLKSHFHYDDALDVVGVHMVGGAIGVVLTGVFCSLAINAAGEASGWTQLGRQTVLAAAGIVYPFVMTWIVLWITDKAVGLRVSPEEEEAGLDTSEHGEVGYEWPGDVVHLVGAGTGADMHAAVQVSLEDGAPGGPATP